MKSINQRRLNFFHQADKVQSISVAAEKLNVDYSYLAKQIRMLEEELNVTLFERRPDGVKTTTAGIYLREFYQAEQVNFERLTTHLHSLNGVLSGEVNIVVSEGYADALINNVINPFRHQHPQLKIFVNLGSVGEAIQYIVEGDVDIGILFNPSTHNKITVVDEATHPVRVIARKDHPLVKIGPTITFEQLTKYPITLLPEQFGLRNIVSMIEHTEKIRIEPTYQANSIAILKNFILGGETTTFMTEFPVLEEIKTGKLVALRIKHKALEKCPSKLIVKNGRPLSKAVSELLACISKDLGVFKKK